MASGRHATLSSGALEPMACQRRSFKQARESWFRGGQVEQLGKRGLG